MSLRYIIRRVAKEIGVSSPELNPEQKAALIDIINQAAEEVYENKDLPISLKEVYVKANTNKRMSLPPFVGEIRAIRSTIWNDNWTIQDLRPRYHARDWPNKWKNFRLIEYSPIKTELTSATPGTIEYPIVDGKLAITLVGETANSSRTVETIYQGALIQVWTNSFLSFKAIRKNKVTSYDVVIKDADGIEIATLYADQLESRYVIIDISQYPSLVTCSDGTFPMEVLYKPRMSRLENDEDTFPVDGFDDVIVIKAKQLLTEDQEGKEQRAILMQAKGDKILNQKVENKTGTIQKKIKFGRNPLLGLFKRCYYD